MPLALTINGENRIFAELEPPVELARVIAEMNLKADRVAVELNGQIASRADWNETRVSSGDRLEVVHFVGGGRGEQAP
jgi:sulfur carrier protein